MKKSKTEKPIGKRRFDVRESIFGRRVCVFLNYTHSEFARYAKAHGATEYDDDDPSYDDNFAAFSTTMSPKNGPDEWIICMKRFNWTIDDQGSLIHEIVHTIVKIFDRNNIPFNADTQEFLAHDVSNLYEDIVAKIFHKRKRKA